MKEADFIPGQPQDALPTYLLHVVWYRDFFVLHANADIESSFSIQKGSLKARGKIDT